MNQSPSEPFDLKVTVTPSRYRGLWRMITGYRLTYVLATVSVGLAAVANTAFYYLLRYFTDDVLASENLRQRVPWVALGFVGIALLQGLFTFLSGRWAAQTAEGITRRLRDYLYDHIQRLSFAYHDKTPTGELIQRVTSDVDAMRLFFAEQALGAGRIVFLFVVNFAAIATLNLRLALISVVVIPFIFGVSIIFFKKISERYERFQEQEAKLSTTLQENLSGVRVVRAYAQEDSEIEEFQKLNREYADRNVRLVKFAAAMRPLLFFFIGLGFVIIVAIGVPMAVNGELTAGNFTSFILYLQRMIWYLIALGYVVNLYQRGTASLKRFNAILETEPTIKDAPGIKEQPPIKGGIEFRELNFSYSVSATEDTEITEKKGSASSSAPSVSSVANPRLVLKDINLKIEPGQTVAFVGRTGSGKSTLMGLIPRLMDAPDGSIFVDGVPVRKYPIEQLRRSVGFVPQETFLFSNTLAANIAFGVESGESRVESSENGNGSTSRPSTLDSRLSVEKAAAIAGLAEDIKTFPGKYEQLVGERGITLSGGQKQRTAIARAVMRDPRILILDDSLSAVDTFTEETILHNLRDVRSGRTTLIVSHRISTIRDADLICVLDHGRIIERGTHEELLELNGEYAELYQRQLLEEELEAED